MCAHAPAAVTPDPAEPPGRAQRRRVPPAPLFPPDALPAPSESVACLHKEAAELATLQRIAWYNHQRLLEPIGHVPPAEAEASYYRQRVTGTAIAACLKPNSLREGQGGSHGRLASILALLEARPLSRSPLMSHGVLVSTGSSMAPQLPSHIPSLDGLRAVSIMLVLIGHAALTVDTSGFLTHLHHLGNLGVRFFFIISGFLITTLLLKEQGRYGRISMRGFYARRALRVFPASLAYIGIIAACSAFGWLVLQPGDVIHALTYTMNYNLVRAWWLSHLWSLSVEEQFYLLWPGLLWWAGTRRGLQTAWMVVLLVPLVRALMWFALHASDSAMTKHFEANADVLAMGCLLSMHFNRLSESARYRQFQTSWLFWPLVLGLVVGGNGMFLVSRASFYVVGQSIVNVGAVLCVDWCIRNVDGVIGRLLNWRPVVYIGVLSYSLYLWQNVFLNPDWVAWPTRFPLNLLLALLMAVASYNLVERPFLDLKRRIASPLSRPVPDDRYRYN